MPQKIDDFTIPMPESSDMGACDLKVYDDLDWLWRMVERYKLTPPISISVIDNKAGSVRVICGDRHQASGWQLKDETSAVAQTPGAEVEFPLTVRVRDAKGNILKMRLQLGGARAEGAIDSPVFSKGRANKEEGAIQKDH